MIIKQLSVFLENKKGRLAAALEVLSHNNINMSAFSLAETTEFGIARIIVDNPDNAKKLLRESGIIVKTSLVLAVHVEDKPGALVRTLKTLSDNDISVEYMYAFYQKSSDEVMMVFKVDDENRAESLLR